MKEDNIQQLSDLHLSLRKTISAPKPSEAEQAGVTSLMQISEIYTHLLDEAFSKLEHALNVHRIADRKNKSTRGVYEEHDTEARIVENTERLTGIMKDIRKYFHHARRNKIKDHLL